MPTYVVDTNIFTQAHRFYYPLDIMPSYWNSIKQMFNGGKIISIDKVKDEIAEGKDELHDWCSNHLESKCFQSTDNLISDYTDVVEWAQSMNSQYSTTALATFMQADKVDAWLIAYAKANNLTLVSYEVSAPNSKKNIKIPDVCTPFGIRYISPIQLLRELKVII